ncbi:MAG: transketolase family protein [Lachnospirales bacterium]
MAKAIREVYGETLRNLGDENENIVVLDADVSGSTKSAIFGKNFPERFFNCGISEYAMVGMAAGMAKSGKIPFVNTFAVFLTTIGSLAARTFMSYSKLPIKMMGAYGGLSDAYDGATHHSLEDIAFMRTLPNVIVMVASDEQITKWLIEIAVIVPEPMYIRLSRNAYPDCHYKNTNFEIGKGVIVKEGTDITIIACGLMVSTALNAVNNLEENGISVRVVDMFCIKPIDSELIKKCATETGAIVTAEEHNILGGLGGAVSEVLAKSGIGVPLEMVGINDCHGESGAYSDLLKKYALDEYSLVAVVKKVVEKKSN